MRDLEHRRGSLSRVATSNAVQREAIDQVNANVERRRASLQKGVQASTVISAFLGGAGASSFKSGAGTSSFKDNRNDPLAC